MKKFTALVLAIVLMSALLFSACEVKKDNKSENVRLVEAGHLVF